MVVPIPPSDHVFNKTFLTIAQWNCRSLLNKKTDLENFIIEQDVDIVCLSEIWVSSLDTRNIVFKNFNMIKSCRNEPYGGVAILVSKNIEKFLKPLSCSFNDGQIEFIGCNLSVRSFKFSLVSVYIAPDKQISTVSLNNFNSALLRNSSQNMLFCGDLNSHNILWGDSYTDLKGDILSEFMDDGDYVVLNTGSPTCFHPTGVSCVDVSFATSNISHMFDWSTFNDAMGSDHVPILVRINLPCQPGVINFPTYNPIPKNIDISRFSTKLKDLTFSFPFDAPVLEKYDFFYDKIIEACSVKRTSNQKSVKVKAPWWNNTCSKAVALRRRALSNLKKFPSPANFEALSAQNKQSSYIIRQERNRGWREFCESLNPDNKIGEIWKKIKMLKRVQSGVAPNSSNDFIQEFCTKLSGIQGPVVGLNNVVSSFPIRSNDLFDKPFTIEEFNANISRKDTSPGPDFIRYSILFSLPAEAKLILLGIYNNIYEEGIIPEAWRNFEVVPILKPAKNCTLASSYRPIAKGSCGRKHFESILKNRLDYYFEREKIIPESQHGFRRGKSTIDSIATLYSMVKRNLLDDKITMVSFYDISGAFDNVDVNLLLRDLDKTAVSTKMCRILYQLFSHKYFKVQHNGSFSEQYRSIRGVPQGSALSPLLFNFAISKLGRGLPEGVIMLQYADDLAIICSDFNMTSARNLSQISADLIFKQLGELSLSISPEKSKILIFKRSMPCIENIRPVYINTVPVQYVTNAVFLGFHFTYNLSPRKHIEMITAKGKKLLNIVKVIRGVWWGADPRTLINLYKGLIRPVLDYCCFLYNEGTQADLLKIDRIQYMAIRLSIGAMCSTHVKSLEVEACIIPLIIRRSFIAEKFILKTMAVGSNNVLRLALNGLLSGYEYYDRESDSLLLTSYKMLKNVPVVENTMHPFFDGLFECLYNLPKVHYFNQLLPKATCSFNERLRRILLIYFKEYITIYTDGSKDLDKVGSAVWIPSRDSQNVFPLNPVSTVFSSESKAILEALRLVQHFDLRKILIISDSQSCLSSIANFSNPRMHPDILRIRSVVYELTIGGSEVEFLWVPAHKGIDGNETVDELAKSTEFSLINTTISAYYKDFYGLQKQSCFQKWQDIWNNSTMGRRFYSIKSNVNNQPWFLDSPFNRQDIVSICRLRFGHVRVNSHLHKINIVDSPMCECGTAEETIDHALFICPLSDSKFKKIFFRDLANEFNIRNGSAVDILRNVHTYGHFALYLRDAMLKL